MAETGDLLVEIGTEELPPKALKHLSDAFTRGIAAGFAHASLGYGGLQAYATPRRLAVLVTGLDAAQPNRMNVRRGPAVANAFDAEGRPSKAAEGFARSCGVDVADLERQETDKGAWLVFRTEEAGANTEMLIPGIVKDALAALPIPKRMRWGSGQAEFVRPVHWVVLLFGDTCIETEILGVNTGRETRGHRFHHPAPMYLAEPKAYAPLLETQGHVLADFPARREAIYAQVQEVAVRAGGQAVIDDELLDEVTAMVEWPVALIGQFDARFLDIPHEALISAMKQHQKYFHVVGPDGRLLPHFVTVSNIDSRDLEVVRAGNERVIRPRLADAEFFWDLDRKRPLAERGRQLADIVFHHRLGSLREKVDRVARLATAVAEAARADTELAARAAELSKCDLVTEMVSEFPDLQGTMGRHYALHDGEPDEVAKAIDEHYRPRHAGDTLPETATGQVLAIADKLDTLVGIFAVREIPTGTKDPFALRRAALGVLRIIIEQQLDRVPLRELLDLSLSYYQEQASAQLEPEGNTAAAVYDFMMERLRTYYHEAGIDQDVFDAVLHLRPTRPYDFDRRVHAVNAFRSMPEADTLAAANKRCHNLLKKARAEGISIPDRATRERPTEPAERTLAAEVAALRAEVAPLIKALDYKAALKAMARLRPSVDAFFDDVMVMVEDPEIRENRLALLQELRKLFLQVADVSRLQS